MKYELVVFDIDGTITQHVSSWQFLHEKLGIWDNQADLYQKQFLAGEISYRKFCELDAAHWRGMDVISLEQIFKEVPLSKNVKEAVFILKQNGFKLAAVSTGIQFMVDRVQAELGLDFAVGNRLRVRKGKLTGGVIIQISHLGKGKALETILDRFGIPADRTVVVGDSEGDLPMMRAAGYSIAFNTAGQSLGGVADYVCLTDNFMEVCREILRVSYE